MLEHVSSYLRVTNVPVKMAAIRSAVIPVQERESEVDTIEDREERKTYCRVKISFVYKKYILHLMHFVLMTNLLLSTQGSWVVFGGFRFRMCLELRRLKEEEMYCTKLPCVGGDLHKFPAYMSACFIVQQVIATRTFNGS